MTSLFEELRPFRQVIWDFNGTLIDDAEICVRAVNPLLREHGLAEIDLDIYRRQFRFPVADYYVDLGFNLTSEEFAALSVRFHEAYHSLTRDVRVFPGTAELLLDLRNEGKVLSVLSAAWQTHLENGLKDFGLHEFFEHVYGLQHRLADSKIQRGRELMAQAGIPASETVLLGDTLHDLEVGEALGVDVILLTDGHMSEDRLRDRAPRVYARGSDSKT